MARAPKQPESERSADFVRSIVTDPKNVPDVMRLYGYPGASSEEGHERLYLSPDLTNYVEIPANAILHRMAVPADQDPHGAVCLWVKKDAALVYKMAPAAQAMAHYFGGAIQAGLAGMGMAQWPGMAAAPAAGPGLPRSPFDACQPPSVFQAVCTPPVTPFCPTRLASCVCTPACPTRQQTPCPAISCGIDCTVIRTPCPAASCGIICQTPACTAHRTPCPGVSCGIDCTVIGPLCQTHVASCVAICQTPFCPIETAVACPPQSLACPQGSIACGSLACGPGGQAGGAPQFRALPTLQFMCTQNCHGPGCGGVTQLV